MELRKCVNHPLLLAGVRDASREALQDALLAETGAGAVAPAAFEAAAAERLLVAGSGKMVFLDKLLPRLRSEGRKVLVFSQFVRVLGLVAELCAHRGYDAEALTGATPAADRQRAIDRFNASPDAFVFLLSTRAGGVGINLCAADTVVIYDSDWNPQNDVQAMARCHRLGQTRDVAVYRLVARKSFEGHMLEAAARKLGLERAVMGRGAPGAAELERCLRLGCAGAGDDAADAAADAAFRAADIDELLAARGRARAGGGLEGAPPGDAVDVDDPDFWAKAMPHMVTPELVAARLDADVGAAAAARVADDVAGLAAAALERRAAGDLDDAGKAAHLALLLRCSLDDRLASPLRRRAADWYAELDGTRPRGRPAAGRAAPDSGSDSGSGSGSGSDSGSGSG